MEELISKIEVLPEEQQLQVAQFVDELTSQIEEEAPRQWFSVRLLFRHDNLSSLPGRTVYEERIVVLKAYDEDDAMRQAEIEADKYASFLPGVTRLAFAESYHLDSNLGHLTEVFSLMRESLLGDDNYIDAYFDDGTERRRTSDDTHKQSNRQLLRCGLQSSSD